MTDHSKPKLIQGPPHSAKTPPKLPIGLGDFKKVAQSGFQYVDKSLFIQAILNESAESILITRPRRFGKSYNLSMLRYFFDTQDAQSNRELFAGTSIAQAKTHDDEPCMHFQGQYPTVFLTLKGVRAQDYPTFLEQLRTKMSGLYKQYRYLVEGDCLTQDEQKHFQSVIEGTCSTTDLSYALFQLTVYLHAHAKEKVIVLLDEYDTPMHSAYLSQPPYHEALMHFMKVFLGEAFKDNIHLQKGVITGILRIGLMDLFSGVNSVAVRTMMTKKYEQFFGFTETETEDLVRQCSQNLDEAKINQRLTDIKAWYNGYQIGKVMLYNPWSILQYLNHDGELAPYWTTTGEDSMLGSALLNANFNVRADLISLLAGQAIDVPISERTVFADLHRNAGALWHLMVCSGYLKVIENKSTEYEEKFTVMIPNRELIQAYRHMVENWFFSIGTSAYRTLFDSLANGDLATFQTILQAYLEESVSSHDLGPKTVEKYYHVFVLGMFFVLKGRYMVDSNKESGYGRFDLVLVPLAPQYPAYVTECKKAESEKALAAKAQEALDQIEQSRYQARLTQSQSKQVIHMGLAFYGKHLHMAHRTTAM